MAIKVAVTYANGVFAPDEPIELEEGARALVDMSGGMAALDEAERLFALAFAGGELDEASVKEGCRLAWDAAKESVARMARARGWSCETDDDVRAAIYALDGIDKNGYFEDMPRYYSGYRAASIFRDRAVAAEGDVVPCLLHEPWQFADGLRLTRALLGKMAEIGSETAE